MIGMRNALHGLLMAALLAPLLACVMAFCPVREAKAAVSAQGRPPCHAAQAQDKKTDKPPMLALDCLGVDLFKASAQQQADPPDRDSQPALFAPPPVFAVETLARQNLPAPRGPPPEEIVSSSRFFVATTRLLI